MHAHITHWLSVDNETKHPVKEQKEMVRGDRDLGNPGSQLNLRQWLHHPVALLSVIMKAPSL